MNKIKTFLHNHLRKITLGTIVTITVVHFIINFDIIQNTELMSQSWIGLINGYILIITMSVGLIFLIWLAFVMHKETAKDLEKFLLKNLTTACFLLIMLIGFHGMLGNLEKNFTLTAIGAIIVFWYGYKTYERDKEIDLIKYYSEKYNLIKIELNNEKNIKLRNYNNILTLWYEEYFLFQKGYISEDLWNEWEFWIYSDVDNFLDASHFYFNKNIKQNDLKELTEDEWYIFCLDNSRFLEDLFSIDYLNQNGEPLSKDKYFDFIISIIQSQIIEKEKVGSKYNEHWISAMNSLVNAPN